MTLLFRVSSEVFCLYMLKIFDCMAKNFLINRINTGRNNKCLICGGEFEHISTTNIGDYQQDICKNCKQRFPKEDIELILLALSTYGGYFGAKKEKGVSLKNIIEKFFEMHRDLDTDKELVERNLKLLHTILLFGYTQQELIEVLKGN